MTQDILSEDLGGGIQKITLNRPDARNAFTHDMYDDLASELERIKQNLHVRAVILTGAGKAFSTGHDVRVSAPDMAEADGIDGMYARKVRMHRMTRIPLILRSMPQPVIAAVNGTVAGGAYAMVLACDISIAAQSAKFVNAIHNAATGHEFGLSYLLPRQVGSQQAAEILFTARPVLADEAERIGLVLRTVPDDELMAEAMKIAEAIAENVPLGIWFTKQTLWHNQNATSLEAAIELEHRAVALAQSTEDAQEKRAAFVEKRKPKFDFR